MRKSKGDRGRDRRGTAYESSSWTSFGTQTFEAALPAEAHIAIPHSTVKGTEVGSAQIDWFLARPLVEPEPVVTVGAEEQL